MAEVEFRDITSDGLLRQRSFKRLLKGTRRKWPRARVRKRRSQPRTFMRAISAVENAGFSGLAEGAKVSYDVVANRGKESAENLRVG